MELFHNKERRFLFAVILIFAVLAAGITAIGYLAYSGYKKEFLVGVENQLALIAEMKVSGLVAWRKERLGDMSVVYMNTSFFGSVWSYLEHPDDIEVQRQLSAWIGALRRAYDYDDIFLLDVSGAKRLSVPESSEPVCPFVTQHALEAMRSGQLDFTDFYRDNNNKRIYLALIVPILNGHEADRAIGALVMRIDPQRYLYPFMDDCFCSAIVIQASLKSHRR